MTKRKRLLLIAALLAAVAVTLGVLVMLPAMLRLQPGVTKANFDRIKIGMTQAEVEEIFGQKGVPLWSPRALLWASDDGSEVEVDFGVVGCVQTKIWVSSNEPILDKIRRWLHLP
jgi:hypothetical protein